MNRSGGRFDITRSQSEHHPARVFLILSDWDYVFIKQLPFPPVAVD